MQAIQSNSVHVTPRPVPVAIYARVSTLHQVGGRFDSCESQAAICRDYIRKHAHEGWIECACHTDAAYSGGTMNRPGIQALKRQIEAGQVKVVLIFKFERVLRNTDEWAPFRAFLSLHGCRLVSATEDLSEETPSGRLKNNLLVSVAEYERLNTAEKVRAKLAELAKRGIWNCGLVPYGYNYDLLTKTLHPHPVESVIVRGIYEDAAKLVSLTEIANALNEAGVRTRARIFKRRDGRVQNVGEKLFKSDSLRNLIRNPIYAGRVRLNAQHYAGRHEALVSADLWERANAAVVKSLQPARCHLQARDKNCHILKGLVFCAHCDRAMIPNASGKRDSAGRLYRYYTCSQAHQEKTSCPVKHLSATLLEITVVQFIGAIARHPEIVRETLVVAKTQRKVDRGQAQVRLGEIDKSLAQADEHLQRVINAITADEADLIGDELRANAAKLKDEKQQLLVEREKLRQGLLECEHARLDTDRLLAAIARFDEVFPRLTPAEQKDLVALGVERVELRAGPAGEESPGQRQFQVRLKLHLERLTDGMEERVVIERRVDRANWPQHAPLVVEPRVVFRSFGRSPTAIIVAPFREEFREKLPAAPRVEPSTEGAHPLHRALVWNRKHLADPTVSQAEFARRAGVTAATFSYHLKLLKLAPEIQGFLLALKTPQDVRRFSLRRMKSLAELDRDGQRRAFARMRHA
ncbi:MAG: recombinase family protein [Opitutaceae bacterium]